MRVVNFGSEPYTIDRDTIAARFESVTIADIKSVGVVQSVEKEHNDELPRCISR